MKPCRKCGGVERYKDGRCKPCRRASTARYVKANPDKTRMAQTQWQRDNATAVNAKNAKWRVSHPESLKKWRASNPDMRRGRYAQNPQSGLAAVKKYNANNPHKVRAINAKYRAKKLQAIPKWFGELDELIIQEAHALAKQRTKQTGFKWHVDHEVPLQSKLVCGFHIGCNIQVIPASANISKGNRHWSNMP